MTSEQDRVHQIMQDIASGNDVGNKLVYDERTKTIQPARGRNDPDKTMAVTPSDMKHFGRQEGELR